MRSHFSTLNLFSRLLFILVVTKSEIHYHITPTWNDLCPQDPCLTLSQFAANSSSYLGFETNVSLSFLPGNHDLDGELFLFYLDSIVMIKADSVNYGNSVIIECGRLSGRFSISETTFVSIKSLQFIGCEGNKVRQVEQFIVEDSIFWNVEGRNAVLILIMTSAEITNTSFFPNTYSTWYPYDQRGRAILALGSSFAIANCTFANSGADGGGVIAAFASSFSIVSCTFTDTIATVAGVIYTEQSSFNIIDSNFSNSTAFDYGGVIVADGSLFNIRNSTFTNNVAAGYDGGAIATSGSSFTISHSTFTNNVANYSGGVMFIYGSFFNISNSTFSDNNVHFGGVIVTFGSSFTISHNTFTKNVANHSGGVIHTSSLR